MSTFRAWASGHRAPTKEAGVWAWAWAVELQPVLRRTTELSSRGQRYLWMGSPTSPMVIMGVASLPVLPLVVLLCRAADIVARRTLM